MASENVPPVIDPAADVSELLAESIGDTGSIHNVMGGYRIRILHQGAFPWDEVFKTLLYRDFKVFVTRSKAEIIIDAQP